MFNDLFIQMAISFHLVYFIKVAELNGNQAGMILMIILLGAAVFSPIAGHCSDAVKLPGLSHVLGRRKAWHLLGVVIMAVFWPLVYTPCLIFCSDGSSWARFAYHLILLLIINSVAVPIMYVNHLAVIAVVAKNKVESVELNVLR